MYFNAFCSTAPEFVVFVFHYFLRFFDVVVVLLWRCASLHRIPRETPFEFQCVWVSEECVLLASRTRFASIELWIKLFIVKYIFTTLPVTAVVAFALFILLSFFSICLRFSFSFCFFSDAVLAFCAFPELKPKRIRETMRKRREKKKRLSSLHHRSIAALTVLPLHCVRSE